MPNMLKSIILCLAYFFCISYAQDIFSLINHNQNSVLSTLPLSTRSKYNPISGKIVQNLDNFDPQNSNTFDQRYFRINQFYKPGGPIFVYVGNHQRFSTSGVEFDYYLIVDIATKLNGHVFFLEHRYYGESIPFQNLTTENLRYLSTDQALADLAHFIPYVKSKYIPKDVKNSPVILVGHQYGGGLVTWFRQQYPHLVTGAWASSALLLAKVDNIAFNEIVGDVYRQINGAECYHHIEKGFEAFDRMIANNESAELSKMLGLCNDMGQGLGAQAFLSSFSSIIGGHLQLNESANICNFLATSNATDDLGRIVNLFRKLFAPSEFFCSPISYDFLIDAWKQSNINSPFVQLGIRQFAYQECSSFGWFPSSNSPYQPFGSGFTADLFYNCCKDAFSNKFDKDIIDRNEYAFNTLHGGLQINVTNVIFTQGEYDPFRALGVQNDLNENSPVFVIPGYHSGYDMLIHSETDSNELKEVKQHIEHIITHWVSPRNN